MPKAGGKITAVVVFFILLFVFAKWGPAINFSTTTQTKGDPFVVTGEGNVFVTPDIAKITVGVQESGASLKTVQDNLNKKSAAITDAVKNLGVKKEDIKTTSYNLYPQYDYQNSPNRLTGYQVSTTYEITIKDFDKINDLIVIATGAGANMEGGINFEINEVTKKEKLQEARSLAAVDAKEKAQGLASAAGINLGKVINISESQGSNEIRPLPAMGGAVTLDKLAVEPSIQAGQTEINVMVTLSFEVR